MKQVVRTSYAELVDMGGFPVRQPLPTAKIGQVDPFLLLHHHRGKIKPGTDYKSAGVGPHPHRGFSPVTFVFEGEVHHRDSRGNSGIVSEGGVQWMSAGLGIIHSERPSKAFAALGGYQEIIQLWVNTPQAHKMDQPYYKAINKEDQPLIKPDTGKGLIRLACGNLNDQTGPIESPFSLTAVTCEGISKMQHTFNIPEGEHSMIYVLKGTVNVTGYGLLDHHNLAMFSPQGSSITIAVDDKAVCLLLSGKPLEEPMVNHGPFVMNSTIEIMEAMRDYQMGKMGTLIEEFD
ncbi:MAG: pirin family protein [Cyclobacteriaceae bacterium]